MNRPIDKLLPLLIGGLAFFLVTGGVLIWPSNIAWLGTGDPLQHYLGWAFFRADGWQWPLGLNPRFGLEISSAITFSDSLPLLAIPFKALSAWLTPTFQYFGLWVLVCFLAQGVFAWRIASRFTDDRWARAAITGFMVIAPPMIWRLHGHISLFSHFLILAAIDLYLASRERRRSVAFALLVALSVLVHAYLAALVAAIWLASLADGWLTQGARLRTCLLEFVGTVGLSSLVAWQAGYFSVGRGAAGGGYGIYRMNLLSLFDSDGWSYWIADLPGGWGDYEGFNYLGLGLLILLVLNLPFAGAEFERLLHRIRRSPVLFLAALGLTVFAVSNIVGLGPWNLTLPLPRQLDGITSTFRSSGRMFWPVYYLITLAILIATLKHWGAARGRWLLGLALCVQLVDTSAGWVFRPRLTSPASSEIVLPMKDPFWAEAARHYSKVRWAIPMNNSPHWAMVAAYAAQNGLSTDAVYLARISPDGLIAAVEKAREALATGTYEPDSLYLLDDGSAKLARESLKAGDMLATIDGFTVLAPGWMGCESCAKTYSLDLSRLYGPTRLNETLRLGKGSGGEIYLGAGWGEPEDWGVWTGADVARIDFAEALPQHFRLTLRAQAFGPNVGQPFEVVAGDAAVPFVLAGDRGEVSVELRTGHPVSHLEFRIPMAKSPWELGINSDIRRLGMGLESLRITPLDP